MLYGLTGAVTKPSIGATRKGPQSLFFGSAGELDADSTQYDRRDEVAKRQAMWEDIQIVSGCFFRRQSENIRGPC